jgi:hypothetical protein
MSSAMPPVSQRERIVFGQPQEVLKETLKLQELVQFDAALPMNRQKTLDYIAKIWQPESQSSRDKEESVEERKMRLRDANRTRPIIGMSPSVSQILCGKIDAAETHKEIDKLARRILKISASLSPASPMKKSQAGLTGPTLLVGYGKSDLKAKFSIMAYILKWTNREEVAGNLLYNAFANQFAKQSLGFSVPANRGFDFERRLSKSYDERISDLEEGLSNALEASFTSVATSFDPQMKRYGEQVMVMERIQGSNLFDFSIGKGKYEALSESQKRALFVQMGKIVPLDIIFGNNDRLLKFNLRADPRQGLATLGSNAGNLMLRQEQANEDPILYAIDNGIDSELVSDPEKMDRYLTIMTILFAQENPETEMAKHMVQDLAAGLQEKVEEIEDPRESKKAREGLKPILADLEEIALPAFEQGIREMFIELREELILAWRSPDAEPLKQQLRTIYPELLDAIEERINIFQPIEE